MENICVVFVVNKPYLSKFLNTCQMLITKGKYTGDICLVVGNDLKKTIGTHQFIIENNIIIKYFDDLVFSTSFNNKQKQLNRPVHWFPKRFQFHKFHIFDTYFKKWDYIFYIDVGMTINSDVNIILEQREKNKLIANRDGVDNEDGPKYMEPLTPGKGLKIGDQFVKNESEYQLLKTEFDIYADYFQTTTMLYSTKLIHETTVGDLFNLLMKYPISITNDQGIISLYFTQIKPSWKQLKRIHDNKILYDYVRCVNKEYVMVKNISNNWIGVGYNSLKK